MRKVLIVLVTLLFISSSFVFADDEVYCENNPGVIEYDASTNTISLNNYYHDDSSVYLHNEWAIYTDGDLTINLTGDNNQILGSSGIYVGGNLEFTGTGKLSLGKLVVDGENLVSSTEICLNNGTSGYSGPKVHYPMSVFFLNSLSQKKYPMYFMEGTYKTFDGHDINNLTIYPTCELVNLENIYKGSPLYRYNTVTTSWDIETENVNGFVIYESGVGTTVNYDATGALHSKDAPVYDVTFYDDLSSSVPKLKYIELAFNESEWGKALGYEILSASNAYEYQLIDGTPTFVPFVVGNTYHELDGLVADRSVYDDGSGNKIGSAFYAFAITKNNSLSIKVLGETSPVYININVVDTHDYSDPEPDFIIPNTGIK